MTGDVRSVVEVEGALDQALSSAEALEGLSIQFGSSRGATGNLEVAELGPGILEQCDYPTGGIGISVDLGQCFVSTPQCGREGLHAGAP